MAWHGIFAWDRKGLEEGRREQHKNATATALGRIGSHVTVQVVFSSVPNCMLDILYYRSMSEQRKVLVTWKGTGPGSQFPWCVVCCTGGSVRDVNGEHPFASTNFYLDSCSRKRTVRYSRKGKQSIHVTRAVYWAWNKVQFS